jgi:hypothetical protein
MDESEEKPDYYRPESPICYNKGENRHKHLGRVREAVIVRERGNWVGKCPRSFQLETAQAKLRDSFAEYRSRQPDKPFRLWTYFEGAVYAARSEDGGTTWHAYPDQDPPVVIRRQLELQADHLGQRDGLERWLKKKWR